MKNIYDGKYQNGGNGFFEKKSHESLPPEFSPQEKKPS
jgi:hypothetical protein